ncbi:MAG: glycosyltransferase, partial [Candidatus Paceibacteria bacterium]
VLESLASNTKVIGLSSGNLECLLDHEGGRLLNTLSTDDWKRAIQEIESESVDHTARNIAVEYSWDNISKEYKKLYDSLVHG